MKQNEYDVDLIFNTYELTYKKVLKEDYILGIVNQNCYQFKNIFVVINNVKNKNEVQNICNELIQKKAIDNYFFVDDYINDALEKVDLRRKDIAKLTHYIDWAIVSIFISKSEYLLKWDADANLINPIDWIKPSIHEMLKNKNFIAACPLWDKENHVRKRESLFENEDFYYTQDFSDQIFLIKKSDFLKPIYKYFHLYSLRVPLAVIGSIFEKRVDSYMRCKGKIRITYKKAIYTHPDNSGSPYPKKSFIKNLIHYIFMITIVIYSFLFFPHKVKDIYKF